MHQSLDGFVAGVNGELDWMSAEMDPKQIEVLKELTESMDTILMGRKMTAGFTTYWEGVVDNQPESPEYPYAKIFVDTPKIVFSRTVTMLPGRNVQVENGDVVEVVQALKATDGKDIIVYGGAGFVSSLISNRLIDELNLFTHPTAIGNGLAIFHDRFQFQLLSSTMFSNGVVLNRFKQKD